MSTMSADTSVMQGGKSAAELRKINKPLVEKKRRGRINNCLETLKTLILDATKKDTIRYSKLEKADVLEMTVKHLRDISHRTSDPQVATINKYRAGFNECATEVTRFLAKDESLSPDMRMSLLNHLAGRLQNVNSLVNSANPVPMPQVAQPLYHPYVPSATPLATLPGANLNLAQATVQNPAVSMVPQAPMLVPTQLVGGQMAYVLSNSAKQIPDEPPKYASTPIFAKRSECSTQSASSSVLSTPSTGRRYSRNSALNFSTDYSAASTSVSSNNISTEAMQISLRSETDSFSSHSLPLPFKTELLSPQESELDVTSGSDFPSPRVPNSPLSSPALDINGNGHQVANRNVSQMSVDTTGNQNSLNSSSSFNLSNATNNASTSDSSNNATCSFNVNRNLNEMQHYANQVVNINENDNADEEDVWRPW